MIRVLVTASLLLLASTAAAQDPELGLTDARLVGDPSSAAAEFVRPQLVTRDRTTPVVVGASAAAIGGLSLVASFAIYSARQSYRQRPWPALTSEVVDTWASLGAYSLWLGVGASGLLVTAEYLLLPESREIPLPGWFAGGAGVVLAAVGLGYAVGGDHCAPERVAPGATLRLACTAGTADGIFGPLLIATSVPLLNIPMVYMLRKLFAGAPDSLSFGPTSVQLRGRF